MCIVSVAAPLSWRQRLAAALGPNVHISATSIFARMVEPGVQGLAYSMKIDTKRPVAMILPLPVMPGSGEDAVRFVSLEGHADMFDQLLAMFVDMHVVSNTMQGLALAPRSLVVHDVGSFIASYVPTRADFTRLDPRFRMPEVLFDAVPHYADYGFAVFQLQAGKTTVHPMAMQFPTRAPDQLFFPTVHVHDGRFAKTARFDHSLYYQTPRRTQVGTHDEKFEGDAVASYTTRKSYKGLVAPEAAVLRRELRDRLPNADTWVAA